MAPKRLTNQLRALDINRLPVGLHLDGQGLYLQVTAGGRSWVYRFSSPVRGKIRDMGLGSTSAVSLAQARIAATSARNLVTQGVDPIDRREEEKRFAKAASAGQKPFKDVALEYIGGLESTWRNPKHKQQWKNTLATYIYPKFGADPVNIIDTPKIANALRPIWHVKPETASRVRQRIERILENAKHLKMRDGDNPAALKAIVAILGEQKKSKKHHPALPYTDMPKFMSLLMPQENIAPKATAFTILTVARTTETRGATWKEFDLKAAIWTVPGERMKEDLDHRVPLTKPVLAILAEMREMRLTDDENAFVFPGGKEGKSLSENALLEVLDRMDRSDITVHGFRSTFKDWASETQHFDNIVSESALAHGIEDKAEAAYRRGDLFDKRRELMTAWADYCLSDVHSAAFAADGS